MKKAALNHWIGIVLYVVFLAVLVEGACRLYWSISLNQWLVTPRAIAAQVSRAETFYPELKKVVAQGFHGTNGSLDVLILSASVFREPWGKTASVLERQLHDAVGRPVRIANLAERAHTSLDSRIKYRLLEGQHFDLVVIYDGINETRANNCPPGFFRRDYSHYAWYRNIKVLESLDPDHPPLFIAGTTLSYLCVMLRAKLWPGSFAPEDAQSESWTRWGYLLRTPEVFRENLSSILAMAHQRKETVVLMTNAYYLPANYSQEAMFAGQLGYHLTPESYPVETWGKPEYVLRALDAHNEVIRELAALNPDAIFVDQERLVPKEGRYFKDICHLTDEGQELFVRNLVQETVRRSPKGIASSRTP